MVELLKIMKALSDETRYNLLRLLKKHDLCVGALAVRLNISEAAVSQHLKVLRNAGIIKGDKRGYYTHYYVERKVLEEAARQIVGLSRIVKVNERRHPELLKNIPVADKEENKDA